MSGKSRPSDDAGGAPPEIRVYRLDGTWGWCYVEPATDIELHSNTNYGSRDEAAAAARLAYPDLPVAGEAARPTDS